MQLGPFWGLLGLLCARRKPAAAPDLLCRLHTCPLCLAARHILTARLRRSRGAPNWKWACQAAATAWYLQRVCQNLNRLPARYCVRVWLPRGALPAGSLLDLGRLPYSSFGPAALDTVAFDRVLETILPSPFLSLIILVASSEPPFAVPISCWIPLRSSQRPSSYLLSCWFPGPRLPLPLPQQIAPCSSGILLSAAAGGCIYLCSHCFRFCSSCFLRLLQRGFANPQHPDTCSTQPCVGSDDR